jgi:hypothetical protein
MSENFKTLYEKSIPEYTENPTFVNSALKGAMYDDYELPLPEQNNFSEDCYSTLNIGTPVSKNSSDTISFSMSNVVNSFGSNHFTLNLPPTFNVKMSEGTNKNGFWKYEEDKTLKEVEEYISSTYHSHYTSEQSKTQTLDLIESIGDAEAFTRSNAIKYLSRFGKKNGKSKMDILKAIHYCVLLYHFAGLHKKIKSDFPY